MTLAPLLKERGWGEVWREARSKKLETRRKQPLLREVGS